MPAVTSTLAQVSKGLKADLRPSMSVMAGPSALFAEAYPKNIINSSYGVLFEKPVTAWVGLRIKYDGGVLSGKKLDWRKVEQFSTSTTYNILSVGGYLDITNMFFGVSRWRKIDVYAHGNVGLLSANYNISNINNSTYHLVQFGTNNNPEIIPLINGGGGVKYRLGRNWALKAEFIGAVDFSDKVDGIAFGRVDQTTSRTYNPSTGAMQTYTGDAPDPANLGAWDTFAFLQIGVQYKFGRLIERFGGRKNWKNLPSMQPFKNKKW